MNSHRQFTGNCHSRCYAVIGTEVFLYWKNSIFWKKRVFNNVLGPEGMILLLPKQSYWTFIIRSLLFVILDNTWESGQNIFFLLKGSPFVEKNCFYRPFESYRKNVINWTIFMKLLCAHRQTVPQTFVILHDTTRKGQKNSTRKTAFFSKNLGFQPPLRYWRKSPIKCKLISRKSSGA